MWVAVAVRCSCPLFVVTCCVIVVWCLLSVAFVCWLLWFCRCMPLVLGDWRSLFGVVLWCLLFVGVLCCLVLMCFGVVRSVMVVVVSCWL